MCVYVCVCRLSLPSLGRWNANYPGVLHSMSRIMAKSECISRRKSGRDRGGKNAISEECCGDVRRRSPPACGTRTAKVRKNRRKSIVETCAFLNLVRKFRFCYSSTDPVLRFCAMRQTDSVLHPYRIVFKISECPAFLFFSWSH